MLEEFSSESVIEALLLQNRLLSSLFFFPCSVKKLSFLVKYLEALAVN